MQRWLSASGIVGQPIPRTIRLRQEGEIRLSPDQSWMPFHADQYYTIDPAAFLWRVSATAAPGIFIRGADSLRNGNRLQGPRVVTNHGAIINVSEPHPKTDTAYTSRALASWLR